MGKGKGKGRKALKNLAPKKVESKRAGQVKGGAAGPGGQTEDDIYIGSKVRG